MLGVRQVTLGVRRFSKSGTPAHVFAYHGLHADGIVEGCGQALAETALERVRLTPGAVQHLRDRAGDPPQPWRDLWPEQE